MYKWDTTFSVFSIFCCYFLQWREGKFSHFFLYMARGRHGVPRNIFIFLLRSTQISKMQINENMVGRNQRISPPRTKFIDFSTGKVGATNTYARAAWFRTPTAWTHHQTPHASAIVSHHFYNYSISLYLYNFCYNYLYFFYNFFECINKIFENMRKKREEIIGTKVTFLIQF